MMNKNKTTKSMSNGQANKNHHSVPLMEDWVECALGEILEIERGGSPRPIKEFITKEIDGINWVKIGDTKNSNKYITHTLQKIKPSGLHKTRLVYPGDFVLSNSMSFGRPFIMGIKGAIHDGWLVLRDKYKVLNKDFLYYILSSPIMYNQFSKKAKGSTVKNLNISIVSEVKINLIPLPEQKAIVKKIDQLFSSLDSGIADLKKAQEQLKIYRQAVLKKAFEGELTKEWREEKIRNYELGISNEKLPSAEELLDQIKVEREKWIENQIEKGNNEAKRIRAKLKKLNSIFPIEKLPLSWKWTNFIGACIFVIDCHNKTAPYEDKGVFLIRTTNVRNGRLNLKDKMKFVSEKTYNFWSKRVFPKPGDIIFTREAPMGEAAIIPHDTKICLGQRTMILRTSENGIKNKYLLYNIISDVFQQRFKKDAIGTGVKHLRVGDVESLSFPLCSLQEQTKIVQQIESRLSVCDKVEQSISESLVKAKALRQSILKKAFEGKLLSAAEIAECKKDKDYEPASVLLERIKNETLQKAQDKKLEKTKAKKK